MKKLAMAALLMMPAITQAQSILDRSVVCRDQKGIETVAEMIVKHTDNQTVNMYMVTHGCAMSKSARVYVLGRDGMYSHFMYADEKYGKAVGYELWTFNFQILE